MGLGEDGVKSISSGKSRVEKVRAAEGQGGKPPGDQMLGGQRAKRTSPLF